MIKRILVPVDFSDPSRRALDYAVEFSRRAKSRLIVLHVVEPVYYPMAGEMYGVGVDLGNVYDEIERAARAQLARLVGNAPCPTRSGPHPAFPRYSASSHRGLREEAEGGSDHHVDARPRRSLACPDG